jgi:DNA repair ATPase RecN
MRKFIMLSSLLAFTGATLMSVESARAEDAAEEEAFDIVMEETGSEKLDAVFKKSEGPLETIATVNKDVKAVNTNLLAALELQDGTPFADALADLQSKAEGKINVAFEDNKMPTFKAEEGVPDNVNKAVESLNASFGKLGDAGDKLTAAGEQLGEAAAEAAELISTPKELGLKATKIPKAISKGNKNVKKLKDGASVASELAKEVGQLGSDVKSAFGG